jgi:hypothetical protein
MTLPGYNHKFGQKIMTDIEGVDIDRAFLAHYHIAAADAVAAAADGILPLTKLGAEAKSIEDGFTQPAVPRNVTVVASAENVAGNVKIHGTNFAGESIDETIALNATATSAKAGDKAFKTITKVDLPARTNTPVKQKAKTEVTTAVTGTAGTVVVQVAGAALGDSVSVDVPVTTDDNTAAQVAAKIAAALLGNETVSEVYTASASGEFVYLEAKVEAAQDNNLALTVTDDDGSKVAVGLTDPDGGAAGVAPDEISIGWEDKFGIPYKLNADELVILKLFNKAVETPTEGTVTADAANLENNVYEPNGAAGAKDIDLYIIV